MRPWRVGVVGLGTVARYYLSAFSHVRSLELSAVCDRDPAALAPFASRVPCHTDHEQMLRRGGLDALVVTAPNDTHAAICADALEGGLPVCVEKPLATDLCEGRELTAAFRSHGTALLTAFHRRCNAEVLALQRRLPHEVPIRWLTVRYLERIEEHTGDERWELDPARCGGGCVADNGPNAYDLARMFLGELSVSQAHVHRDAQGVDRQASVTLRAEGGATAHVELDWSFPGERKDIEVGLADGRVLTADMLARWSAFKGSLWHEYVGVLRHFAQALDGAEPADGGLPALELVAATYRTAATPDERRFPRTGDAMIHEDGPKRTVTGTLVKVLAHHRDDRGMTLEPYASRCVRQGELHELVTTDHTDASPGARVDRVAFLGFVEILEAGVIDRRDEVRVGGEPVGVVLGFDACHFPNHYNILVSTASPRSGHDLGLHPEIPVSFHAAHAAPAGSNSSVSG